MIRLWRKVFKVISFVIMKKMLIAIRGEND